MKLKRLIFIPGFLLLLTGYGPAFSQTNIINKTVTYEESYDDPYDINKLFFQIQPLYGEFFRTNINAGFGIKADYYLKNKADFSLQFRKPYSKKTDFVRDLSSKNNDFENSPKKFWMMEAGGAYHFIDKQVDGKSRFVLFSRNYLKDNKWESMEHENIQAPVKVRRIYAVRAGGTYYQTALDLNDIAQSQKVSILDTAGNALPGELKAFSNMTAGGFYLGAALTVIKNVALKFDKTYDPVSNDLIFTAYFDLCYYPAITVEDLYYRPVPGGNEMSLSTSMIKTNPIGVRLGIEGKFNRDLSWGYGIEAGLRPGISNQGAYLQGHVSFPLIGSKLSNEVEAFGK